MRFLPFLPAFLAFTLLPTPARAFDPHITPDYLRDPGVALTQQTEPAERPWDDARSLAGSLGVFLLGDFMFSSGLLDHRTDMAKLMLAGSLAVPLLDFAIRLNLLQGHVALSRVCGHSKWLYLGLGNAFLAYGLVKTIIHGRKVIRGIGQKAREPRWGIVPYAGTGVFGLGIGGTF